MSFGYAPSRHGGVEVEVQEEENDGMDVDTPPLSAATRPEQAVLVHDGLGHAGNLAISAEQHAGADIASGGTANDAAKGRGYAQQGKHAAISFGARADREGLSGQGVDETHEGEQWENSSGLLLRGEGGLLSSESLGRRDSEERSTLPLRCSSFQLAPHLAVPASPSTSTTQTISHSGRHSPASDRPSPYWQVRGGQPELEADTDAARPQRGTIIRPLSAKTLSSRSCTQLAPAIASVLDHSPQRERVASTAYFTARTRFSAPPQDHDRTVLNSLAFSSEEDVDIDTAKRARTATIGVSLLASASSSLAAPTPGSNLISDLPSTHSGGQNSRLDARSRGSLRPQPIKSASYWRHLPAPYPASYSASLPSATTRHRLVPTIIFHSRFDLHSRAGMIDMSSTTPDLNLSRPHTPADPCPSAGEPIVSASLPVQPDTPPGSLAPPSGAMSMTGRRQAAPAWPSPRREPPPTSHREIIARSAGLAPPGHTYVYAQTPSSLRVPPSAQWSPAFHRSGHGRQHAGPYAIPASPTRVYIQPPHSANPTRRAFPSSAPMPSSPRVPDHLLPFLPSPTPVRVTRTPSGTYRYENVTVDWVSRELHMNAPRVWNDLRTTDCKIAWSASKRRAHAERVSPMRAAENGSSVKAEEHLPGSAMSGHLNQPSRSFWPPTPEGTVQPGNAYASGVAQANANVVSSSQVQRGRRPSLPEYDQLPTLEFRLHQEYLYTQSRLLRLLLASSPAHMDVPVSPARLARLPGDPDPSLPLPDDLTRGAKFLSPSVNDDTGEETPTLWVPVPDPESFGLIVHWLYWGDRRVVEDAMSRGLVSWEGVVHNITYLGLEWQIKKVVGDWWRRWAKMEVGSGRAAEQNAKWLDEDEEDECKRRKVPINEQVSDDEGETDIVQQQRRRSEADAVVDTMLGALNKL